MGMTCLHETPSRLPVSNHSKMIDQGVEDQTDRRDKDIERSDHSEKEALDKLIEENEGHEENPWPGMNSEDRSLAHLVCFLCNLIVLPTGFTFFLEHLESRDSLICCRWIKERSRKLF